MNLNFAFVDLAGDFAVWMVFVAYLDGTLLKEFYDGWTVSAILAFDDVMEVRIKSEKKKLITFFILVIGQHPVGLEPTNPQSYDNATTTGATYSNCSPRNILVLKRFEFFLFLIAAAAAAFVGKKEESF